MLERFCRQHNHPSPTTQRSILRGTISGQSKTSSKCIIAAPSFHSMASVVQIARACAANDKTDFTAISFSLVEASGDDSISITATFGISKLFAYDNNNLKISIITSALSGVLVPPSDSGSGS